MQFRSLQSISQTHLRDLMDRPSVILSTGLDDVDAATGGGIAAGEVCIIAARPSHGKTSLVLNMLLSMASEGHRCLLVSEEMSQEMISERFIQMRSDVKREDWNAHHNEMIETIGACGEARRVLVADHCGTVENVCKSIKDAKELYGVNVAAVDYLQMVRASGTGRYEQVTNVSMALKHCAIECGVTMLVAAQLGRDFDKRGDGKPRMSDLRESGQIEQDADVILFGYWPIKSDPEYQGDQSQTGFSRHEEYRIFVGKNRNRGIRQPIVFVGFNAMRQQFRNKEATDMPNYEPAFSNF